MVLALPKKSKEEMTAFFWETGQGWCGVNNE
jgi:hypothetical protein